MEIVWVFNVRKAVRGGMPMPLNVARRFCRVFPSHDWGSFHDAMVPLGKPSRPPYGALIGLAVLAAGLVTLAAVAGSQGDHTRYCQPINGGEWACSDSPVTIGGSR